MATAINIYFGDLDITQQLSSNEESQSYDFVTYDIASGKPLISSIGLNLKTINLNISLKQALHNIPEVLKQIEDMFKNGNAYTLMIASEYKGEYVIKNIRRQTKNILPNGTLQSVDLTLELLEFEQRQILEARKVEQKPKTAQKKSPRKATAKINEQEKKQEVQITLTDWAGNGGKYTKWPAIL